MRSHSKTPISIQEHKYLDPEARKRTTHATLPRRIEFGIKAPTNVAVTFMWFPNDSDLTACTEHGMAPWNITARCSFALSFCPARCYHLRYLLLGNLQFPHINIYLGVQSRLSIYNLPESIRYVINTIIFQLVSQLLFSSVIVKIK